MEPFPGESYLVVSHATIDGRPELGSSTDLYDKATSSFYPRSRDELGRLLSGLALVVEPGLVWIPQWRPGPGEDADLEPERSLGYAAVARKP